MKALLFYKSGKNRSQERLLKAIRMVVKREKLEIYRTMNKLMQRLRQPKNDLEIAILLAESDQTIEEIFAIRDYLDGLRIILILPNREADMISKARMLYPRFLDYVDSDFSDVCAVLEKMIANTRYEKGCNGTNRRRQ